MPPITKLVSAFTTHNVSTPANYNATTYPAQTGTQALFTGKTNRNGTVFAIDKNVQDDSQNAASPMVISKESVRTLMPAGWPGRIACHAQVWWGLTSHPNIGFNDQDAPTMQNICNDLKSRGYDVFIPDWYHPTKASVANDTTVDVIAAACLSAGMKFMVMIDQQYFDAQGSTTATYQADLISAINHLMDRYAGHAAYEHSTKIGGVSRPLILLWGIASRVGTNVDWNAVRSAVTSHSNPLLIQYQAGGFGVTQADGALSWLDSNADAAGKPVSGVSYLTSSFLPACTSHQSKICISSVLKGFNGTLTRSTSWSLGKYLDQQDGFTWLDWWATNAAYVAGGKQLDYVATITLDDFQEGSAVQCGIRTAVVINANPVSGNIVTFSVTGDERTMRQYNLWGSLDGVTAVLLASVNPGTAKQFDLANLPGLVTPGTYTLYLEAQAMPSLQNQMAPQTFTQALSLPNSGGGTTGGGGTTPPPPPPPTGSGNAPTAILNADTNSGINPLTVNFDASSSFDATGTIMQYRFDFGDGTTATGNTPTLAHIYTKAGTFLAQLTVTDDSGANGIATITITVTNQQVVVNPGGGLPGPPPPPPPLPEGDPKNPIKVTTPAPVPTPDPRRTLLPTLPQSQQERMRMISQLQELIRQLQVYKIKTNGAEQKRIIANMTVVDAWGRELCAANKTTWTW